MRIQWKTVAPPRTFRPQLLNTAEAKTINKDGHLSETIRLYFLEPTNHELPERFDPPTGSASRRAAGFGIAPAC